MRKGEMMLSIILMVLKNVSNKIFERFYEKFLRIYYHTSSYTYKKMSIQALFIISKIHIQKKLGKDSS